MARSNGDIVVIKTGTRDTIFKWSRDLQSPNLLKASRPQISADDPSLDTTIQIDTLLPLQVGFAKARPRTRRGVGQRPGRPVDVDR